MSVGRRNGQPAAFFSPPFGDVEEAPEQPEIQFLEKLFINLNAVERETWRKILSAQSVASIAKEEGVSRQAIYARIQGNRKGQGGMIAKNFWVLLWWQLRQRLLTPNSHS